MIKKWGFTYDCRDYLCKTVKFGDEIVKMIGGDDMIKYDVKMRKALEFLKEN